jgi:O-acetyl-ADP-ribose deacetylase (regulator of RNase III)
MKFGEVKVEVVHGNIADQPDLTAIVNAANASLATGGGVAGAIHKAAGPGLAEECKPKAPISPGEAVISGAHELPNNYVLHCLGPVYGRDKPSDQLLANCYKNVLQLAEENKIDSIGFPAISTGAFGYPFEEATDVALQTTKEMCESAKSIKLLRFILFSESQYSTFSETLEQLK